MSSGDAIGSLIREAKLNLDHHLGIIGVKDASNAVRRNAATKLLDEMASFMARWEQEFAHTKADFPSGILREAFASLLAHVGSGDGQLRAFLLKQLSTVTDASCRQFLLDFLPSAMPANYSQSNVSSDDLETVTTDVIETLRSVLSRDSTALLPVLGCLSIMPLSATGKKESFQVALSSLEYVSESELPTLVTTLLRHADSEEDASRALESIRMELDMVESSENLEEKGEDPLTMVAHVVLNALFDEENDNRIAKAYSSIFHRLTFNQAIHSKNTDRAPPETSDDDDKEETENSNSFLLLDLSVLLSIYQHPMFIDSMEKLLDTLLKDNTFPFQTLSRLLLLISGQKRFGRPTSILYRRLISCMVSFCVFLLLAPARICNNTTQIITGRTRQNLHTVMKQTEAFIVNLQHHSDREIQTEIVHILLHLNEESANSSWSALVGGSRGKRAPLDVWASNPSGVLTTAAAKTGDSEWFQILIDTTVNNALQQLAKVSKGSFNNFKHVLIERLTDRSFRSSFWERRYISHLCAILSALFEPSVASSASVASSGGIQASEIMILLQKLLFSSSFVVGKTTSYSVDHRRVVRGLLLATELIKSPFLRRSDCECVRDWVLRILLPATRRMVDPEIASPGLRFLEALATAPAGESTGESHESLKKNHFQYMKMVLANTGMIQILAHYLQQQPSQYVKKFAKPILGYTADPDDVFTTEAAKKRKRRKMVFCLAFFLRNSDLYMPSRWVQTVKWVFHLVDTYLRIGRDISLGNLSKPTSNPGAKKTASGKWAPHGWLEAAVEFPAFSFPMSIEAASKKQQCALDWVRVQFGDYKIMFSNTDSLRREDARSGIVDLLSNVEEIEQLEEIVESALRLALGFLLGISLSLAVVKNSHAHYTSIRSMDGDANIMSNEQNEILTLIEFQMFKIYDMKERCKCAETLLLALFSCVSRTQHRMKQVFRNQQKWNGADTNVGSQIEHVASDSSACSRDSRKVNLERRKEEQNDGDLEISKKLKEQLELALVQLRNQLSLQFASQSFLTLDILLECLDDGKQTKMIKNALSSIMQSPTSLGLSEQASLYSVISFRNSLLENVTTIVKQRNIPCGRGSANSVGSGEAQFSLVRFSNYVEIGLQLSLTLPRLRRATASSQDHKGFLEDLIPVVAALAASYLHLIRGILTNTVVRAELEKPEPIESPLTHYAEACLTVFTSNAMLDVVDKRTENAAEIAFAGFLRLLQDNEDLEIADEILEILSALATSSKETLIEQLLHVHWKSIHTVYWAVCDTGRCYDFPYALPRALRLLSVQSTPKQKALAKCLQDTVLNTKSGKAQRKESASGVHRDLIRHWSVGTLNPEGPESCIKHMLSVYEELSLLVGRVDGSVGLDRQGEEKKVEDGNVKRGKRHESPDVSSIPLLTAETFVVAYQTLLHVTVASMGFFSISGSRPESCSRDRRLGMKESGPYCWLENLLCLFSGLLGLYMKHAHLFPKSVLSSVFVSSKHMLIMTMHQVKECVEWRNSQPLLSVAEKTKGRYDPGAICYLQKLVDVCWTHTSGKILSLCEALLYQSEQVDPSEQEETHSEQSEHEGIHSEGRESSLRKICSISQYNSKVNTLRFSVGKVTQFLKEVASTHNLTPPSFTVNGTETKELFTERRKSSVEGDAGYHQLNQASKSKQVAAILRNGGRQGRKRALDINNDANSNSLESESVVARTRRKFNHGISISSEDEEVSGDSDKEENCRDDDDDPLGGISMQSEKEHDFPNSFGAMGNWGDEASEESSTGSLGLEVDAPLFG